MKRWMVWLVSAALCVGLMGCAEKSPSSSPDGQAESGAESAADSTAGGEDAAAEAYQAVIAERTQEDGEDLSWVRIPCGTGEDVLALTRASAVYADGQSMEADFYQYADGRARLLTTVSSTGTAYPLAFTEEAVLFSGNHQSGKLTVHEGTGELSLLTNVNIEGKTPVLEVYAVEDGELTLTSSEELTAEQADELDWYGNAFAEETAQIIVFP